MGKFKIYDSATNLSLSTARDYNRKVLASTRLFLDHNDTWLRLKYTGFVFNLVELKWQNLEGDHGWVQSFEEVLDDVPKEVQTELLFHLDLFAS